MNTRRAGLAASAVGVLLALSACGGGSGGTSDGDSGSAASSADVNPNGVLNAASTIGATPMDPHRAASDNAQFIYTSLVYDRLTKVEPGLKVEPMLATSWKFADDGLSADFSLRDDVTFSDGEKLDAAAVKASLDRAALDPASTVAKSRFSMIESVEVVDPLTVRINTKKKAADLPAALAGTGGAIVSPKALGNKDLDVKPVGSGPYELTELKLGEKAVFERRADYWNKDDGLAKTVSIVGITDDNARINALRSGQVDLIVAKLGQSDQVEAMGGDFELHAYPPGATYNLLLNSSQPPLDNVLVRQALNFAIDREGMNKALLQGRCEATSQALPPGFAGHLEKPPVEYTFDQDKAKALLAEAGVADGFELDILTGSGLEPQGSLATAIQAQFAEIGVKAKIVEGDTAAFLPMYGQQNHDSLMTTRLGAPSPISSLTTNFLSPVYMPGGSPEELSSLIATAADPSLAEGESTAALEDFSAVVNEQALDVFICNTPTQMGFNNKRLTGVDEMGIAYYVGTMDLRKVGVLAD